MKPPRTKIVGECLAAILIAGCSGVNNSTADLSSATALHGDTKSPSRAYYSLGDDRSHRPISDGLKGETFRGTFTYRCGLNRARFKATGTATGPYPGPFVATGWWRYDRFYGFLSFFHERFTITSAKKTIHGSILGDEGSAGCGVVQSSYGLGYKANEGRWQGSASASIGSSSFDESFQ
jgi:hypothetical protein